MKSITAKSKNNEPRSNQLKQALRYARRGWPLFPVHSLRSGVCSCYKGGDCGAPGKHPMTPNGMLSATTDLKQIKRWWRAHPNANIGIVTGDRSGLLVLDIDPRNSGDSNLSRLERELGRLPTTRTSSTGGNGRHFLFKMPNFPVQKDSRGHKLGKGIDVLSNGAYFIAPSSNHVSGRTYKWSNRGSIAKLPSEWISKLKVSDKREPLKIREGDRNNWLFRKASKLRADGQSEDQIVRALQRFNSKRCSPPLESQELAKIAASASKYQAGPRGAADSLQALAKDVLDTHYRKGKHILVGSDKQLWSYNGVQWKPLNEEILKTQICDAFNGSALAGTRDAMPVVKQVLEHIRLVSFKQDDPLSFKVAPRPVINCLNGEVWIRPDHTIEFREHRYDSYQTTCLQVRWDPKATCPLYDKTAREIFRGNKALIKFWNELVGYLIQPSRRVPLIVILLGGGSNGKTGLMQTVMKLLGDDMVAAQSIDTLSGNRFATAGLVGKRIILDDDVKAGVKLPDGELKRLSEEKEISAERKHGAQFNFVVRTVPVLICNNTPTLADVSSGMRRRLTVVPFEARFMGANADKTRFARIQEDELSGVLAKAVRGYLKLSKRGLNFKFPKKVRATTNKFFISANPLPAFVDECCIAASGHSIPTQQLYRAFCAWARDAGVTRIQQRLTFKRNLELLGYTVGRSSKAQRIVGLALKSRSSPPQ